MATGQIPIKANARRAVAVTPSDTAIITPPFDALYVGGTGAIKVDTAGTDNLAQGVPADASIGVTFVAVPVGPLAVSVSRVYATGTAATNIVGLYW